MSLTGKEIISEGIGHHFLNEICLRHKYNYQNKIEIHE